MTIKLIPDEVLEKNRRAAEKIWGNGKPEKWYFAVPAAAFWILALSAAVILFIKR